jgi:putative MATE family efflux protein
VSAPSNNVSRESASPALDPTTLDVTEEALHAVPGHKVARALDAAGLDERGRLRSGRLAGLSMRRAVWILYWPIVLESLLTSLVGMTDTYLSAQISVHATDAIGGASYLLWFIGLVVMAVGVGATALISRSVGAGRFAVANAAVGQTVLIAIASGAAVALVIAAAAAPAARLMNLKPDAVQAFVEYMWIVALGVPCMAVLSSLTACARGAGDSFRPLLAMVVVNIVNMVLSFALAGVDLAQTRLVDGQVVRRVFLENPFEFDLGIRGIALGTIIAELIGMAIVVAMLIRGTGGVRLRARRLRPHWHTMRRLLRVGLPSFFETFGMWIGNFAVILLIGRIGSEAMLGSHIIGVRLEALSFGPGFAMGMVASILAGQYLGAGSTAMARRAILFATVVAALQMGLMGILFIACGRTVTGFISSQPEHLELVPPLLFWAGIVQVPFAVAIVLRVGMRGAGDAKWVMWLTWITTYAVRLPLVYLASGVDIYLPAWLGGAVITNPSPFGGTLEWIWIAFCIEILIRAVLFLARFLHGGWLHKKV